MYYVYLGQVLLPVAPNKLTLKIKNQNKTMTLINEGEINFLKAAGLTDVEFDVLIPSVQYSFAKYDGGFKSPSYFMNHFETLKNSNEPFQFIVVRKMPDGKLLFDTNMTVSMESYTITEQSDEGFDLKVSFKLKQYIAHSTKIVKVTLETNKPVAKVQNVRPAVNSPAPKQETTYTVQTGDSPWSIAKKFYGDGSKYMVIVNANKDKITSSKMTIYTGQVLVIPSL